LYKLIDEICLFKVKVECSLQVVHDPGLIMIDQGTDRLSCGIWMSVLQGLEDSGQLTQAIFKVLKFNKDLVDSCVGNYHLAQQYVYCDQNYAWDARACSDWLSL
jgi:hypothetical protein